MRTSILSIWNIHLTTQILPFPSESFISYQGVNQGILYELANSQKDHSPNSSTLWFAATVTMSSSSFSSMRWSCNRYYSTTGIFCSGNHLSIQWISKLLCTYSRQKKHFCEFLGFQSGSADVFILLQCGTVSLSDWCLMIQDILCTNHPSHSATSQKNTDWNIYYCNITYVETGIPQLIKLLFVVYIYINILRYVVNGRGRGTLLYNWKFCILCWVTML
jgi:hypothetical protein